MVFDDLTKEPTAKENKSWNWETLTFNFVLFFTFRLNANIL